MGILGLKRRRNVARNLANLLGANGAMTVDSNADGLVDGFGKVESNAASVFALDYGQKITLANVVAANGYSGIVTSAYVTVSPNLKYTCSIDAALVRSTTELVSLRIEWYTAAGAYISVSGVDNLVPGATYTRQKATGTAPATAGKALLKAGILASAVGDSGSAWFKDALFQQAG